MIQKGREIVNKLKGSRLCRISVCFTFVSVCITFHFSYKSEAQIQFYSAQSMALMPTMRLRRMHKERTKNKRNCSCLNELLDKLSHPVIQSTYICGGLDDWMKSRENLAHLQNSVSDLNKNSKKPFIYHLTISWML